MVFSKWPHWFLQACGGIPSRYVCWDLETIGQGGPGEALIWQVGHVVVVEGKVVDRFEAILNWADSDLLRAETVQEALQQHQLHSVAGDSARYRLSWERLTSEGQRPERVMTEWPRQLQRLQQAGFKFVGHNVYNFDEKVLYHFIHDLDTFPDFSFGDWDLFDTCILEKLNQLEHEPRAEPRSGDTLRSYLLRSANPGAKVYSNLPTHCVSKYGLRPPTNSKWDRVHNASYDAYLCFLLMEIFKYNYQSNLVRRATQKHWRQRNT